MKYLLARYVWALLINFFHAMLLVVASPYAQRSTAFLAVVTSSLLMAVLLVSLLIHIQDAAEDGDEEVDLGTFDDPLVLPGIIFGITLSVLATAAGILLHQLRVEAARLASTFVLLQESGAPPTLILADSKSFHLFLSHIWRDKDVVAMIKLQLRRLLPGVNIFLDVDNLASIDELEEHVKEARRCSSCY